MKHHQQLSLPLNLWRHQVAPGGACPRCCLPAKGKSHPLPVVSIIEHSHTTYHNVKVPYLRTKSHSREVTVRYRTRDGTCQDHGQDQDRTETRDTPMSTTSKAYDGGRSA